MKKSFKKILASFLAISTLAVGATGLNASAATDSASWSIRYAQVHQEMSLLVLFQSSHTVEVIEITPQV